MCNSFNVKVGGWVKIKKNKVQMTPKGSSQNEWMNEWILALSQYWYVIQLNQN